MGSEAQFIFIATAVLLCASAADYKGHQIWRVTPESEDSIESLFKLGERHRLDFWKDPVSVGHPVDIRVPPKKASTLRNELSAIGFKKPDVAIPDIQALIDSQQENRRSVKSLVNSLSEFDYSVYHTPEEMYQWIDLAEKEYPFITKVQVGATYQGRPIYALEIKKNSDGTTKPAVYVDALIHCREWIATAATIYVFKEMLENPEFSWMIDELDWYFVPMINVDGYTETWHGDRLWRKTLSTGSSNLCSGTDANRNWDSHWSGPGASGAPCSYTYYGPTAASESEVRHLQYYIMGMKDILSAVISTHSFSQLILYPFNYDYVLPPDNDILYEVGENMSNEMYSKHNKRYVWGPGASTIYICSGVTTDWTYEKAGVNMSYTFELRDEGQYGFLLPDDQIIPTGEELALGYRALASYLTGREL